MSRRRQQDDPGSLDLLLDTICNIFGLLVFVAVIAAVLARARADTPVHVPSPIPLPEPAVAPVLDAPDIDPQELGAQIHSARAQIADLEEALARVALPDPGSEDTGVDVEHEIESLQAQIQAEQDRRTVEMRLPRRRAVAGRIPAQLVVKHDRLYIINDWRGWSRLRNPQAERCTFWTTWNTEAVDADASSWIEHEPCWRAGGQDLERLVKLLVDGGIDLSQPDAAARIRVALRVLDPKTHVASIKVDPDSFDTWSPVRSAVLQRRVPYDVAPVTIGDDLIFHDRIRSGTASAQ
ncbi:MAG: hypothetical protein MK101_04580 [Phycisphaerales bacterium]|nr:hypothetical protein [Phycisphaerales bacterium]